MAIRNPFYTVEEKTSFWMKLVQASLGAIIVGGAVIVGLLAIDRLIGAGWSLVTGATKIVKAGIDKVLVTYSAVAEAIENTSAYGAPSMA